MKLPYDVRTNGHSALLPVGGDQHLNAVWRMTTTAQAKTAGVANASALTPHNTDQEQARLDSGQGPQAASSRTSYGFGGGSYRQSLSCNCSERNATGQAGVAKEILYHRVVCKSWPCDAATCLCHSVLQVELLLDCKHAVHAVSLYPF